MLFNLYLFLKTILFVAVNNSHIIKKYDITESGLALPGIEVSTNNSGPREMCVVDDKLYFTNWLTKDIKVLDLVYLCYFYIFYID